eukprot:9043491-Lingulodinium_polyedra.AAC.1
MPEKRPPPFMSPLRVASEFGIFEQTAFFREQIVPAVRLDLKEATEEDVESAISEGLVVLEAKCSGGMDMTKANNIQSAVISIRELIRRTVDPKVPYYCCKEPDMVLTDGE